jgi:hypothetical protein
MTDVTASAFAIGPCTEFTPTATVSGPPQVIGSDDSLEGPISSVIGSADGCSLPGGSDLPGTVVHLGLEGTATATDASRDGATNATWVCLKNSAPSASAKNPNWLRSVP